jgi:hypothetical protein
VKDGSEADRSFDLSTQGVLSPDAHEPIPFRVPLSSLLASDRPTDQPKPTNGQFLRYAIGAVFLEGNGPFSCAVGSGRVKKTDRPIVMGPFLSINRHAGI